MRSGCFVLLPPALPRSDVIFKMAAESRTTETIKPVLITSLSQPDSLRIKEGKRKDHGERSSTYRHN